MACMTSDTLAEVLRYAAFSDPAATGATGNPAGVVLDAAHLDEPGMRAIAAELGYAETAFVTPAAGGDAPRQFRLRFFSPIAEVPFCGHATVATAVALAERLGDGAFDFETSVGPIRIATAGSAGRATAAFTSVEPEIAPIDGAVLATLLSLLGLSAGDLHPDYPPMLAFAGNWHPELVLAQREVFDSFDFDPTAVRELMDAQGWAGTVTVSRVVGDGEYEARNLFPVGTITEDPATGSAAASFGGYLRSIGAVGVPARIVIHQGAHVGRPSLLTADIPERGGIVVRGGASAI